MDKNERWKLTGEVAGLIGRRGKASQGQAGLTTEGAAASHRPWQRPRLSSHSLSQRRRKGDESLCKGVVRGKVSTRCDGGNDSTRDIKSLH